MAITEEQVLTIASLARLEIDRDSARAFTNELGKILAYVEKLNELDTSGVQPTLQVSVDHAPLRSDDPVPGLSKRDALSESPRSDDVGFLVPGFVE